MGSERTRPSNKIFESIIVKHKVVSLCSLEKSKSRSVKGSKKNVSSSYKAESNQNKSVFVYNSRRVSNMPQSDSLRNAEVANIFKTKFRKYFSEKSCIKGKNEMKYETNKLLYINRIKHNFIEFIEENLYEDNESYWDNQDMRLLSKTPDPTRKYAMRIMNV